MRWVGWSPSDMAGILTRRGDPDGHQQKEDDEKTPPPQGTSSANTLILIRTKRKLICCLNHPVCVYVTAASKLTHMLSVLFSESIFLEPGKTKKMTCQ